MSKLPADVHPLSDPAPHLFWITSRAAGNMALMTSSLSVGLGLTMVTRELKNRGRDLRVIHESLSLITLVALGVHGIALLGDTFMHPSVPDVLVPFTWSYRSTWTSIGIIAGWTMLLLGPTFYIRTHIGASRWRALHRFATLAWLAGLAHAFGEGTDAGQTWFIAMTSTVAVPAIVLLIARLARASDATPASRATSRQRTRRAGARPLPAGDVSRR